MRLRFLAVVATAFMTVPAAAQAAEINTGTEQCIRIIPGLPTMPVFGTGFTPGSTVVLSQGGSSLGSTTADGAGSIIDQFFPPSIDDSSRNTQTFQIVADDGNGFVATMTVPVTRVLVKFPSNSKPRNKVRFRFWGFATNRPIYMFVRRNNKTLRRVKMGRTSDPCGRHVVKKKFLPLKSYTTGTYDYYWGHEPQLNPSNGSDGTWVYRSSVLIYRKFSR